MEHIIINLRRNIGTNKYTAICTCYEKEDCLKNTILIGIGIIFLFQIRKFMKKFKVLLVGLLLIILSGNVFGQIQFNKKLKKELDSIYFLDQMYRKLIQMNAAKTKTDSLVKVYQIAPEQLSDYILKQSDKTDSLNIIRIAQIIDEYGYPGKSLVGEPTNESAYYVIQHSKLIDKYLPIIKESAIKNELAFHLYAKMLDRHLMYNEKEQVYGTQIKGFIWKNPQTGSKEFKYVLWPVKDPDHLKELRERAGFTQSIDDYLSEMAKFFKTLTNQYYTLQQIKEMQKQL
jgi:hypothetical protein